MVKSHPSTPFARYADDAVAHCHSKADAERLKDSLAQRMNACGLELHPDTTRIIYCKDDDRKGDYSNTSFDFLGYIFRPRRLKNKQEKHFINFTPAVSNKAKRQCAKQYMIGAST